MEQYEQNLILLEKIQKFNAALKDRNIFSFSSDMDWACEDAIAATMDMFKERGIKPYVFSTHESAQISSRAAAGEIDVGIHPNFLQPSSQGSNFDEVLDFCFSICPNARGYRGHRYFEVNDTMEKMRARGVKFASNVCSLLNPSAPFLNRSAMVSFPIFMEDGSYIAEGYPFSLAQMKKYFCAPGLKVINIHPMHFMLNTPYFKYTRDIKDRLSRSEWNELDGEKLAKLRFAGAGISSFLLDLCGLAKSGGAEIKNISQLYDEIISL